MANTELGGIQGVRALLSVKEELEEIKNEFLQANKSLAETTYQASVLYDRWVVEHQHVARREAEMLRGIELLNNQIQSLGAIKYEISQTIQTTVSKAAVMVADITGKEVLQVFHKEIDATVNSLSKTIDEAKGIISSYRTIQEDERFRTWAITIGVSILVGVIVGGSVGWWCSSNVQPKKYYRQENR